MKHQIDIEEGAEYKGETYLRCLECCELFDEAYQGWPALLAWLNTHGILLVEKIVIHIDEQDEWETVAEESTPLYEPERIGRKKQCVNIRCPDYPHTYGRDNHHAST
jgi:hypothetical protein